MKIFLVIVFSFFYEFSFGQRMPHMDSIVTYDVCNNKTKVKGKVVVKERIAYREGKIFSISSLDSASHEIHFVKNIKTPERYKIFVCGTKKFVSYNKKWEIILEYESDSKGIIWRKQYRKGKVIEEYKRE